MLFFFTGPLASEWSGRVTVLRGMNGSRCPLLSYVREGFMGVVPYWGRQPAAYLAGLYGVHCMSWVVELGPKGSGGMDAVCRSRPLPMAYLRSQGAIRCALHVVGR